MKKLMFLVGISIALTACGHGGASSGGRDLPPASKATPQPPTPVTPQPPTPIPPQPVPRQVNPPQPALPQAFVDAPPIKPDPVSSVTCGVMQKGVETGCWIFQVNEGVVLTASNYLLLEPDPVLQHAGLKVCAVLDPRPNLVTTCQQGTPTFFTSYYIH